MENLLAQAQSTGSSDSSESGDVSLSAPDYLTAADSHNVGNSLGNSSWFSDGTTSGNLTNWKFYATAALSGADSLYNSAATVGKWVGVGEGGHDTGEWISSLDDNLGQYYSQNRQAVDLAGFVATSFIPGLGGVKLLNAGQKILRGAIDTGAIGGNLARATGLLVPQTELYVKLAAKDIASSSGATSLLNLNTLKALGSGVHQNVLEAAAFETVVQASMFKSPILDGQDGWDITKNIAFGGLVGGVLGGAFEAARSTGAIRRLSSAEITEGKFASSRVIPQSATPADQQMILTAESRDMRASPVNIVDPAYPLGDSNYIANKKLYDSALEKDNNAIRTNINSLVKGTDGTVGNMTADALHNVPAKNLLESMLHAKEIGTIGSVSKLEAGFNRAVKALDLDSVSLGTEVRYVKLTGEGMGTVVDSQPVIHSLADAVKSSKNLSVEDAVLDKVKGYGFKVGADWDASALKGVTAHTQAEARYIWADRLPEVKAGTVVNQNDIPLLERIRKDIGEGTPVDYKVKYSDGSIGDGLNARDLDSHLEIAKQDVANSLLESMVLKGSIPVEHGTAAISKIVNVKQSYLEGTQTANKLSDLYARQDAQAVYHQTLVDKGVRSAASEPENLAFLPSYAKVSYETAPLTGVDGNILDGMNWIKSQQKMYQESADRVFAKNAGTDIAAAAPVLSDNVLINASLSDGGAGLVSFANGGYGSLGSYVQQIGANVTRPLKAAYRKATAEAFESPLVQMGSKKEAAIEFDVINNKIASTTEQYVLDVDGHSGVPNSLIAKSIRDYHNAIAEGKTVNAPVLQRGAPEYIPVQNQETYDTIAAHIGREGERVGMRKEINAALGATDEKLTDIFRPIRPNPNDYKFFAFVKDDKVTGAGHTTMIHAQDEATLRALTAKVPADSGYRVIYKDQAEDYYKATKDFEYSRTLNENYVDSDLKSRGINSQFFTKTDPQKIVDDILQYHLRADDVTATELVRMKYQPAFDWLEDQGKQFTQVESSQYGSVLSRVEKYGKNPYTDYTKTALDVSKASEYSLLYSANRAIDSAVSNVYGKISSVWESAKTPAEMDGINSILESHGIDTAYNNAAMDALVNHSAPKAVLSKFIRTSNGILSKFVLALDPLNGLNNAIGANILRSTELKQLTDAINSGDSNLAGQLGDLAKIAVPGAEGQTMLAPTKLLAQSLKNFTGPDKLALIEKYKSEGLIKDSLNQFHDMLDDFSLKGTESAGELDKRLASGFAKAKALGTAGLEKGEVVTGNKFFEQFNRFMSADVMRQITDLGESAGLMTDAESKAYRNTFVNRVEGNTIASQRPVMFQGPIGQALGLFQSYQFNLMQQMFRYVGEGSGKDAAMLLGLQGTLYGINGLPAFNAINTHIVGNLSGNTNHTDLYDATYGIAGKTAGDFLMYGIPSSIIQTNLYSRGDINPRSLTIIPSQISDIPVVSAYAKVIGGVYNTVSKIANGGNVWESFLQGVEHNGISRPLAGLAQDLQATTGNGVVFSTTSKGSILGTNDFLSLASLSRIVGGRPLDEAILNDGAYRIQSYEAMQKKQKDTLLEAIKSTGIQGQVADQDSMSKFAATYAATGGKQMQFNKYILNAYKSANTSQSQRILAQLSNPFNQKMQILMGGRSGGNTDVNDEVPQE